MHTRLFWPRGMHAPDRAFTRAIQEGVDLAKAVLAHGNSMDTSLARADLRGADLAAASLHAADLARLRIDQASRTDPMQTTRTRDLPRYRAPTA